MSTASELSHDKICSEFTFAWKIVNISHCVVSREGRIESPVFPYIARQNTTSQWKLLVYPRSGLQNSFVTCELKNLKSTAIAHINCYFCVCTIKQELLYGEEKVITSPLRDLSWNDQVVAIFKRDTFEKLLDDTVVFHIHMWMRPSEQNKNPVHFFTETRLGLERHIFEVSVKNFSSLRLGEEKACTTLTSLSNTVIHVKISISGSNPMNACAEIRLYYENVTEETFSTCTLWLKNKNGKVIRCGRKEFWLGTSSFEENVKKFSIWRNEVLGQVFQNNDVLVVKGEVTLSGNSTPWEQVVYGLQTTEAVDAAMNPRCLEVALSQPSLPPSSENALSSDMRSMMRGDGPPFDLEIVVRGRSFPVHQIVLAARSKVFRVMLARDRTKELEFRTLELNDLDVRTAQWMILYAYTDEGPISQFSCEWLANLYAAADRYAFVGLKRMCGQLLLEKMDLTNAPNILVIADRYKDLNMKNKVVDFLASKGPVAIESENWKLLEQGDSKLANDVMRQIINKKHRDGDHSI